MDFISTYIILTSKSHIVWGLFYFENLFNFFDTINKIK